MSELLVAIGEDPSLSITTDGAPGLKWTGEAKSSGMEFNFHDGEIWSSGTPDDLTLRKMQDIAHRLDATLVMEDGETFDLDAPVDTAAPEPLTRGQILFRVYVSLLLVAGVIVFFVTR